MPVSKRLRYEVLKRDNHTCRYCGAAGDGVKLTIDHVTPVALGGSDSPSNLATACFDCNIGKSSTAPDEALVEDVSQDALRWARAIKVAAETLAEMEDEKRQRNLPFREAWQGYDSDLTYLPGDWRNSVECWLDAGLSMDSLLECLDIAMGTRSVTFPNVFAYCGGIARKRIENVHELARRLIAAQEAENGS